MFKKIRNVGKSNCLPEFVYRLTVYIPWSALKWND
ncbi:hypothetical protein T01_14349 [Trichinella spiralis]|uniref:Uncharacterized protein n=1 Tax=Trichinella spiralis TaxID=6334 RepID=A0A0V0XDC9_TRISP|nr:hypothetical protein T01_14349 [Trichinella spiralis]